MKVPEVFNKPKPNVSPRQSALPGLSNKNSDFSKNMDMFKRKSVAVSDIKQSIKAPKPRESVLPDNLINMQNEQLEPTKPENMFIK